MARYEVRFSASILKRPGAVRGFIPTLEATDWADAVSTTQKQMATILGTIQTATITVRQVKS